MLPAYFVPTKNPPQVHKEIFPVCDLRRARLYFGRGGVILLPPNFQGMICHRSLLLTTISGLYGTCPSSRTSCAVVISYWLPHFQPPSYSKEAILTICIVLYYSFFQRFCKYFNVLSNYNRC